MCPSSLGYKGGREVRFVVIRKPVKKGESPRKQLKLLNIQEELYDYQVIATNSHIPAEEVWHFYNKHACCENFIKEGIYGFGLDKSVTRHWAGARLYFELVILAYNLMNWFKEMALGQNSRKEMAIDRLEQSAGSSFLDTGPSCKNWTQCDTSSYKLVDLSG